MPSLQHNDGRLSNSLLLATPYNLLEASRMQKNFLRQIRKDKDLTLEEVASRAKTTNQQISMLESGKRKLTWDWIQTLADALGVHPMDITLGPASTATTQTEEEKELLQKYRTLDDSARNMYLHTLRSFAEEAAEKKKEPDK